MMTLACLEINNMVVLMSKNDHAYYSFTRSQNYVQRFIEGKY